jgi:activator of 2-hydroxyglutaryl-CoA dehydratase
LADKTVIARRGRWNRDDAAILNSGVAKNTGVVKALEKNLKIKVKVPPEPQIVAGAGGSHRCCAETRKTGEYYP